VRPEAIEKLPGRVIMIVAPEATPVGVTKLMSWFARVFIFAEERVSERVVSAAAYAVLTKRT
jgi:hypothetical protein